ncbi:MAG: HEAT repeat domain-containing protein [bacterium]
MKKMAVLLLLAACSAFAGTGIPGRGLKCPSLQDEYWDWEQYSIERSSSCSASDIATIWAFLERLDSSDDAVASIKNNLLDRLVELDPMPADMGDRLLRLYREKEVDLRMRDFVLQHFAPYIKSISRDKTRKGNQAVQDMMAELQDAMWSGSGVLSGTALLAMESLASLEVGISMEDVGTFAVHLAKDEKRLAAVRATAMQVATRLGRREILAMARVAARSGQPLALRVSAISCLGRLGEGSDLELLAGIQDGDQEEFVKSAAEKAKGVFQARRTDDNTGIK